MFLCFVFVRVVCVGGLDWWVCTWRVRCVEERSCVLGCDGLGLFVCVVCVCGVRHHTMTLLRSSRSSSVSFTVLRWCCCVWCCPVVGCRCTICVLDIYEDAGDNNNIMIIYHNTIYNIIYYDIL